MNRSTRMTVLTTALLLGAAARADNLWDNGPTDGLNGLGHVNNISILDDFLVPHGPGWWVKEFRTRGIWDQGSVGQLTDVHLTIWSTGVNSLPKTQFHALQPFSLSEQPTGNFWFGRPEVEIVVEFEPVYVPWKTWWIEMRVEGNDLFFQMSRSQITNNPAYYYDGQLHPGWQLWGQDFDVTYQLCGTAITVCCWIPDDLTIGFGGNSNGGLADLIDRDDQYVDIRTAPGVTPILPVIQLEVAGVAEVAPTLIESLAFVAEASCNSLPSEVPQRTEVFNYRTGRWEIGEQKDASLEDELTVVVMSNPVEYVEPGSLEMRARMSWFEPGNAILPGWRAFIDQAVWVPLLIPVN